LILFIKNQLNLLKLIDMQLVIGKVIRVGLNT